MNIDQTKPAPPGFLTDTIACWKRLPNKVFFFTLLAAWGLLFQFLGNSILGYVHTSSIFAWLFNLYNQGGQAGEDASVGKLIPFLVIALFWWKRKELLTQPLRLWWPGLLLLTGALLLHLIGYIVQQTFVSVI